MKKTLLKWVGMFLTIGIAYSLHVTYWPDAGFYVGWFAAGIGFGYCEIVENICSGR